MSETGLISALILKGSRKGLNIHNFKCPHTTQQYKRPINKFLWLL